MILNQLPKARNQTTQESIMTKMATMMTRIAVLKEPNSRMMHPSNLKISTRILPDLYWMPRCHANLHGCTVCRRPTHIFFGGRTIGEEEGYGQKVICRNCVGGSQNQNGQTSQTPSDGAIVRLSDLKLRTPPSAKAKNVNPYLVYATEAGHFRRVYFTCVKCSNSTA